MRRLAVYFMLFIFTISQPNLAISTMNKIHVIIGKKIFVATLVENTTATTFKSMLPLTISMKELNNNEKYGSLPKNLPINASVPASIQTGDLMLFGSNTIVVFYKPFSTSYSYTKVGKIDDTMELQAALGTGDAMIEFKGIE